MKTQLNNIHNRSHRLVRCVSYCTYSLDTAHTASHCKDAAKFTSLCIVIVLLEYFLLCILVIINEVKLGLV